MQGDCRTKPTPTALGLPASDLGLWKAPQCVIVNDHTIFLVFSRLWLNALYLRLLPSSYYLNIGVHLYQRGEVYGTDLTMQGTDPGQNCSALRLAGKGKAYIAGVRARIACIRALALHALTAGGFKAHEVHELMAWGT